MTLTTSKTCTRACKLLWNAPFHEVLNMPFRFIVLLIMVVYWGLWLLFVPFYMAISTPCDLDAGTFLSAFYYRCVCAHDWTHGCMNG